MNTLLSTLNADQAQIQSWRHHMHRHPELAFDEHQTASYIAGLLRGWGYAVTEGIGKTGVVASLKVGNGKRAIGLRADTDALAVQEMTTQTVSDSPATMLRRAKAAMICPRVFKAGFFFGGEGGAVSRRGGGQQGRQHENNYPDLHKSSSGP